MLRGLGWEPLCEVCGSRLDLRYLTSSPSISTYRGEYLLVWDILDPPSFLLRLALTITAVVARVR